MANDVRFREVFNDYYDVITRYCLRRLPQSKVHDATANTFLVAWKKIERMPYGDEALPWLYGVARNEVRNLQRSTRRSAALWAKLNGQPRYLEPGPEALVIRTEEQAELVQALETLSPADQEILRLRAYEHLTIAQIATVIGCSPEAAKKRSSRALARLRQAVDRAQRKGRTTTNSRVIPKGGDG